MNFSNQQIASYFEAKDLLKKEQIEELLKEAQTSYSRFDEVLKAKKILEDEVISRNIADFLGVHYLDLDSMSPNASLIMQVPLEFLKKTSLLPLEKDVERNEILVGCADPIHLFACESLRFFFPGKSLRIVYVDLIKISRIYDLVESKEKTNASLEEMQLELQSTKKIKSIDDISEEDVSNAPAVKIADSILKEAVNLGASDIHIEPYEKNVRVRYRIDGMLLSNMEFTKNYYPAILTRYKIIANMNIAERRIPQDGRISLTFNGINYDFRVSTLPTVHGEKIVIRIYDNETRQYRVKDLGFLPGDEKLAREMIEKPHGIILLTGPTGSGKSTTLYAFLRELNQGDVNIITVEDPVENEIYGINQTQVNTKANLTFAAAMRSILRQDPNIIMIGEIRDEETAQIAIRAAITGHLVLSTLHTNDAPGAVNRLVDMGVPSYLVADSTIGVISQRLVRKLCPFCKEEGITTATEMKILELKQKRPIWRPVGCNACNNTGYKGRIGIHEIMNVTAPIRKLIDENVPADELREGATLQGMRNLYDCCREKVLLGQTSIQELEVFATSYEHEMIEEKDQEQEKKKRKKVSRKKDDIANNLELD